MASGKVVDVNAVGCWTLLVSLLVQLSFALQAQFRHADDLYLASTSQACCMKLSLRKGRDKLSL